MRISHKKNKFQSNSKRHKTNQFIHSEQVRLIDENGENIGVIDTIQALEMAQERGLDLVEVSPLANPPVAKIVDYSKLKYEEEKERRKEKAKQKKVEVKGIRLSLRISEHDIDVRVNQAQKFIEEGDKVKIDMQLRGREMQRKDLAKEIMNKFVASINALVPVATEAPLSIMGGRLSTIITKK
ncbi:MAG: translation initiation factor IF-3 [Candidatus Buchananbacteria bacterium]